MAIGSLGSLVVSMALDTARFEGDLGKAAAIAERRARQISRTFNTLATAITGGLFVRFIADAAAAGDEMLAMAERTGRSVESLSQLDFVAKRGNTSIEALLKSQDQLAKNLGATDEEGKKAAAALAEIGLEADRIRSLSPDEKLDAVAEALGAIEDPAKRARIEMALFGKAGTEIDNVMRESAGGIRELREEADRLGITVTDLEARRLSALDDQLEATKGQFNRLKLEIAGILAQPIGSYLELVSKGLMGWRVLLGATGDEMEELNLRVAELTLERDRLRHLVDAPVGEQQRAAHRERLAEIAREMEAIRQQTEELLAAPAKRAKAEAEKAAARARAALEAEKAAEKAKAEQEAVEKAAEAYAKFRKEIEGVIALEQMMNALEIRLPTPILSDDELERELERTDDLLQAGAKDSQKALDRIYQDLADSFKGAMAEITVYSEQAARNVQDAFADFLFDPFEDGLRGMLRGFLDVLRRMVAEIAASQILGKGSSGGGFLGSILGGIGGFLVGGLGGSGTTAATTGGGGLGSRGNFAGLFARGGFVRPGEWGVAGEKGAEPIYGGRTGVTVQPSGRGAGITYAPTYNVGGGFDPAQLPAFAETVKQDVIDTVGGMIRGGAFA